MNTHLARVSTGKPWLATALYLLIILAVVAGFVALQWVTTLPERVDEQQTIVLGQTRFAPDSDASVRVVVQDFGAGQPIASDDGAAQAVSRGEGYGFVDCEDSGLDVGARHQDDAGPVDGLADGVADGLAGGGSPVDARQKKRLIWCSKLLMF
jgi:hypothetical protein